MLQFNSRHFEFNFIWHHLISIQFKFAAIELIQLACTHATCHIARYDDAWSYLAFTALTWPWPHLPNPNPACDRLSGHPLVRTSAYSLIPWMLTGWKKIALRATSAVPFSIAPSRSILQAASQYRTASPRIAPQAGRGIHQPHSCVPLGCTSRALCVHTTPCRWGVCEYGNFHINPDGVVPILTTVPGPSG